MSSNLGVILLLLVEIAAISVLAYRTLIKIWDRFPQITKAGRVLSVALLLGLAAVGGDKSPAAKALAQFVTALADGTLLDPSGRLTSVAVIEAAQTVAMEAESIIEAASNAVADAQSQFDALVTTLTNANLTVAYISLDMPRAIPGVHINSNVAGAIQRTRQDGDTNLLAWVWFSQQPTVVPQVAMAYTADGGKSGYLPALTNSYPDTIDVDGVPCVEYRYEIPSDVQGIAFRPDYELIFGGAKQESLIVPKGGIIVVTNSVEVLSFTGTDHYSDNLSVTYAGGVAVSARFLGTNYTGVVNL